MKIKTLHKALIAAIAITAAGPASAVIATSATGNGELFFSVFDSAGERSYTRDLGIYMNNFLPSNAPNSLVIGADTLFSSWLAATAPANSANIIWNIHAVDSMGADRALTTTNSMPTGTAVQTNTQFYNYGTTTDVYLGAVNALGTHPGATATDYAVNGSNQAGPGDGVAYFPNGISSNWSGQANFNTTAKIGESLNFYLMSQNGTLANNRVTISPFTGGAWSLSQTGTLVYAVPEADTWAMFAGGLFALGAIARRRKSSSAV